MRVSNQDFLWNAWIHRRKWMAAAMLVIAMSLPAIAQVGANVGGTVTDTTGAAVPGATVTITNSSNGETQVIKAGAEGTYRAVNLPPATYQITAEAQGFGTSKKNVGLLTGSDVTADFALGAAGVSETVTVTEKRLHWSKPISRLLSRSSTAPNWRICLY